MGRSGAVVMWIRRAYTALLSQPVMRITRRVPSELCPPNMVDVLGGGSRRIRRRRTPWYTKSDWYLCTVL